MKKTKKQLIAMGIVIGNLYNDTAKTMETDDTFRPYYRFMGIPLNPKEDGFDSLLDYSCRKYKAEDIADSMMSIFEYTFPRYCRESLSDEYKESLKSKEDATDAVASIREKARKDIGEKYGNIFEVDCINEGSVYLKVNGHDIYLYEDSVYMEGYYKNNPEIFKFLYEVMADCTDFWALVDSYLTAINVARAAETAAEEAEENARMKEIERLFAVYGTQYGCDNIK